MEIATQEISKPSHLRFITCTSVCLPAVGCLRAQPASLPQPGARSTNTAYSRHHSRSSGWGLIPSELPGALPFLAQKPCRPSIAPTPLCADRPSPWDPDPSWSHEKDGG